MLAQLVILPENTLLYKGEVNRPGDYFINNNIPYILVLLEARGYTDNADASKVIVERKNKSVILDLSIPVTKRAPHLAEKFILHPYDIVTVPSKSRTQKNQLSEKKQTAYISGKRYQKHILEPGHRESPQRLKAIEEKLSSAVETHIKELMVISDR